MKKRAYQNPWVIFLPFLALYIVVVCLMHKDFYEGDEGRYVEYAHNLLHGFYSPKAGDVQLWNGPGYPIALMPLVALKLPPISYTILNAFFHYLSLVVLYNTLLFFVSKRKALVFSLFWGCYYICFKEMSKVYSESFAIFLIVLLQYLLVLLFSKKEKTQKHLWLSGFVFGFLILTKVMFAYVLYGLFFISISCVFILRKSVLRKLLSVSIIAFLFTLPYLFYTYKLTGKALYWASTGGSSLYWASTPYEGEFGDWNNETFTTYCGWDSLIPCNSNYFSKNHENDYKIIRSLNVIQQDSVFKKIAVENIKKHPLKYAKNCIANFGRMVFGVPQSFYFQRFQTFLRIPPNAIVFTFLVFNVITTIVFWRRIKFVIFSLVMLMSIYLGGSLLICSEQRQFYVIIPIILLWTAYLIEHFFQIKVDLNSRNRK